jgi:tripartite ATP-independent transporter DctM subunit
MGTVAIVTMFNPAAGPPGESVSLSKRFVALLHAAPLIFVIIVSIGGIYLGVFTPVEAAGIGAGLVILMAFAGGKLNMDQFSGAVAATVRTTAMLYLIVIGASILNPFLAVTHLPATLGEAITSAGLGPYGVLFLIIIAYLVLGMFMDGLAMLVVTIPIFFPIMTGLGFDPIWFGVIAVILIEMGMITPPVGLNVFVVKSVAGDVPMATIFKGVLPFWFAMAACLLAIIIFPQIALIIPQSMYH